MEYWVLESIQNLENDYSRFLGDDNLDHIMLISSFINSGLELENKHLSSLKDDNIRFSEENDRLRAHYEVLKEHELSIIKDYEAKI